MYKGVNIYDNFINNKERKKCELLANCVGEKIHPYTALICKSPLSETGDRSYPNISLTLDD